MAPHDAFGREIGEDAPSLPTPAPEPAAELGPQQERSFGPAARTVASLAVALLIVAAITAAVIVGIGGKDEDGPAGGLSVGTKIDVPAATAAPEAPGKPAARRSLVERGALAAALRKLRSRGRLRLLRVAPDRIDAQLVTRAGGLRNVQVTAEGAVRDFGTAGSAAGGLPTIPFGQVDAAAPARIVRAAARRSGRRRSRIDYLVLLMLPTGQSWNAYFEPDGLHFMADRHGTEIRRL